MQNSYIINSSTVVQYLETKIKKKVIHIISIIQFKSFLIQFDVIYKRFFMHTVHNDPKYEMYLFFKYNDL